jgi:hypothetical protein
MRKLTALAPGYVVAVAEIKSDDTVVENISSGHLNRFVNDTLWIRLINGARDNDNKGQIEIPHRFKNIRPANN